MLPFIYIMKTEMNNPDKYSGLQKSDLVRKYDTLYETYSSNIDIYFKGSSMYLIIVAAVIGFIFKGSIDSAHVRIISSVLLLMGFGWYYGNICALRYAKSVDSELKCICNQLDIPYQSIPIYPGFTIVWLSMFTALPIMSVFLYLLIFPQV